MKRKHWIFDLDGTLTVATHDFDSIRQSLGLPPGKPILEQLAEMPADSAEHYHQQLDDIERQHASQATPQAGVHELLDTLTTNGASLGIVTRNTATMAHLTLAACRFSRFFSKEHVVGREIADPKPDPAGLTRLMRAWNAVPGDTVMVGDYLFDLQAGRNAGCATVAFNNQGHFKWPDLADYQVSSLSAILQLPIAP